MNEASPIPRRWMLETTGRNKYMSLKTGHNSISSPNFHATLTRKGRPRRSGVDGGINAT